MVGIDGGKGSRNSVLPTLLDDDDDDKVFLSNILLA